MTKMSCTKSAVKTSRAGGHPARNGPHKSKSLADGRVVKNKLIPRGSDALTFSTTLIKLASSQMTARLIGDVTRGACPLSALYPKEPMERVALVRHGFPASIVGAFSAAMGVSKERVYATFGLPRATATRKASVEGLLSAVVNERVVCVAGLILQVENMTTGIDEPRFTAPNWVAQWLEHPHPALGSLSPAALLDTADGRAIVSRLIAQIATGVYA